MTTQVPNALLAFDGGALGFRNRLINGAMQIDQRNNGASQTFTAAAAVAYCVDRWYASCTGANITGQRANAITGGYTFTGAASNSGTLFGQRIESLNAADLVNSTVTGQVKLSSSSITAVTWTAYYANTQDNFSAKTQIATGSITINSTPTTYTFSFNAGANAANGIAIEFTTGALLGSQTLTYGTAQLEAGPAATAFERRPAAWELSAAQRYYEVIAYLENTVVGAAANIMRVTWQFKQNKRAVPTVTYGSVTLNPGTGWSISNTQIDSVTFSNTSANSMFCNATASAEL